MGGGGGGGETKKRREWALFRGITAFVKDSGSQSRCYGQGRR